MSEVFNFKRFWTFFRYDLKQMWRRNAKPAIFIGGAGLILLLLWSFFSTVCFFTWTTPPMWARLACFFIASFILQLYITKTYGFITDKKKGSDYLMIPASRIEKFISMMIIVLVVIPFLFTTVYLCIDALICVIFPSCGTNLFQVTSNVWTTLTGGLNLANAELMQQGFTFQFTPCGLILMFILSSIFSYLFFMLCGMIFRRFKILWALLINYGLGTILSSVLIFIVSRFESHSAFDMAQSFDFIFTFLKIAMALGIIGLGWGVYYRLKKIQH